MDIGNIPENKPHFFFEEGQHRLRLPDLFKLSIRVFRVRPLRTFLTILASSMGIGTVLFLVSLGYGLQYILIGQLAGTEDSLITLESYYPLESNLYLSEDDIKEVSGKPGADEISPVAEFPAEIKIGEISGFASARLIRDNYFRLSGVKPDIGDNLDVENRTAVVSNSALKLFNLPEDGTSLGKKISLDIYYQDGNTTEAKMIDVPGEFEITGIIQDEAEQPVVLIPVNFVPEKPPFYQKLLVKAEDINKIDILRDDLIKKGLLISARLDLVNQAKKIMNIITIILGVFGVAALMVSAIGMFNTMIIGFMERIFEVGIMKSIGASVQDIRNLFLMESFIMGAMGGLGGILIGFGAGEIFNLGLNFLAKYLGGKSVDLFIYPLQFLALIFVLSALVGLLAGFWPARRAAQLSPKQAFTKK